jgi:hypothetical protein
MDTSELAKQYTEQALSNVAVRELYDQIDVTDINSNSYKLEFGDSQEEGPLPDTVTFDKYAVEMAPFVDRTDDNCSITVEQGMEADYCESISDFGELFSESVYDSFTNAASDASYHEPSMDGVSRALETYEHFTGRSATRMVVDDELFSDDEITSIQDLEDIAVFESENLDLGTELLVSNDSFGYEVIRKEMDASSWQDSDHAKRQVEAPPVSKDNPEVVSVWTRRAFTEVEPKNAMRFTVIGN